MENTEYIILLQSVGLTQIEAAIYLCLLDESPLTGYAIASKLGKSRSNVYQALKTLELKGGINRLEDTGSQAFTAVPVDEFLKLQETELKKKTRQIKTAFKDLKKTDKEGYIYRLKKYEQVIHNANDIIRNAKKIVIVDAETSIFPKIKSALENAASRGIKVVILGYDNARAENCELVDYIKYDPPGKQVPPWKVRWFCISADGESFLISILEKEKNEVISALCSNRNEFSGWIFSDMLYEIIFIRIIGMFKAGLSRDEIWQGINDFAANYFHEAPGINTYREDRLS